MKRKKKLSTAFLITGFVIGCSMILFCGCGRKEDRSGMSDGQKGEESQMRNQNQITVTSENLHDGVWDAVIANTSRGKNQSPELSWTAVEGAAEYAVYMVDPDGQNWIHWILTGVTGTEIPAGADLPDNRYVGPYPPSGTHRYIVTVYALKQHPDIVPGNFDSANRNPSVIRKELDTADGKSGNILAEGSLEGTYTR